MAFSSPQGLRQRRSSIKDEVDCANGIVIVDELEKSRPVREEVVWGKTPDGQGKWAS